MTALLKATVALFLAAEVAIVVAVGEEGLYPVVGWAIVAAVVVAVALLVRNATARVALAVMLVAGCVVFAAELGLFFVPAAAVLLGAAVNEQQKHRTPHHHRWPPLHAGR
jgi:hypothetical protein